MPRKDPASQKAYNLAHQNEIRVQQAIYHAAHREERNAYNRAYNAAHREEQRAATAAWRLAHPSAASEYHASHREEEKTYAAAYQILHRGEITVRKRATRAQHPESHRASEKKRRAQKKNALVNDFTAIQWRTMQEHYNHCCAYCGRRAKGHLTQDHITPLSQGGSHTLSNIIPACRSCNSKKQTGPVLKPVQPLLLL